MLCYSLGDLIKDSTEQKNLSEIEMQSQMAMLQKLSKAAYEAKLKGATLEQGIYSYSREIEDEMLSIYDAFRYIESGEAAEEDEFIMQQIAEMERQEKRGK